MQQDRQPSSDSADTDINRGLEVRATISSKESSSIGDVASAIGSTHSKNELSRKQYPEKDRTIISSRPPIFSPDHEQLGPKELGQTLVGRRLAHFELREFVGGGGMGAVFRAVDTMLQRDVAVKVLSRDQGSDDETVRRFRNEAQSAARLDHENIARVYFVGEEDGWYFIVFEFIDGTNIRDLVANRGLLNAQEAFDYTLQIAEALNHAAERNVVHRDIKPSNVLITHDGRAKLVDMGLARLHHVQSQSNDLTATGVTLGTFDYISPEQARDPREADVRSDIYSLGCTLFYMLTGRPPFPDGTVLQKLLSHSGEAPPDPRAWRKDIPIELTSVLSRMLAKKPTDRYQHPSDLIGELLSMGERLGWRTATRGEPIFIAATKSRFQWVQLHLPWILPAILFSCFMLCFDSIQIGEHGFSYGKSEFILPVFKPNLHELPLSLPADESASPEVAEEVATEVDQSNQDESPKEPGSGNESTTASKVPITDDAEVSAVPPVTAEQPDTRDRIVVWPNKSSNTVDGYPAYSSLAEAMVSARRREIGLIELRLDHAAVVELPEVDSDLTIRAARGYTPQLHFDGELSHESHAMFHVANSLTLDGVDMHMIVPLNPGRERWTMFDVAAIGSLTLKDCTITIRNSDGGRRSYLPDVAVVRLGYDSSDIMLAAETELDYARVSVLDSAVRGEATFLKSSTPESVFLEWQNGLFLSTEQLVCVVSANDPIEPKLTIELELKHLTAIVDGGLAEFRGNSSNRQASKVVITAEKNVIRTKSWSTLITHSGSGVNTNLDRFVSYRGNGNCYHDVSTFWKSIAPAAQSLSFDFNEWKFATSDNSTVDELKWPVQVVDGLAVSEHFRRLYDLEASSNPSLGVGENQAGYSEVREFPSDRSPSGRSLPAGLF